MKNVADIYPLSAVQLGMLFHTLAQETSDESGVYVNQYTCELKGTLQVDLFQQAWQQTIDRHAVLRTAFLWEGLDQPLQVVRQQVNLPWQWLDWRSVEAWETRLDAFLAGDRTLGFNLAKAPLIRLTLIQRRESVTQLVWTSHHMLFDGWSLPLIWQDMLAFYQALLKGKTPEGTTAQLETVRPYRDYIAWQKEQSAALSEQFWRSQLRGFNEPTPLPAALTVPYEERQTYQQQTKRLDIAPLKALARAQRLTLNTLVQGAWALLLHHYTQQDEVLYGSVVSGRPAALSGVEKMVGLFINTLPVRAVIDHEQSVANWLQAYQQQLLSCREHETTALSDLQRWSDLPAGTPLFESIVVFENYPTTAKADLGFTVENARYLEQSNYPLALLVVPAEDLTLILLYDANRFAKGAIARLLQQLELLLTAFVAQPNAKLSHLPRLIPIEQSHLSQPPQPNEHNLTIHQLIERQIARLPQAQAVVFNGQFLTYEALNQQANQLAGELRLRGVTPGSRVALCLNRSVEMVVCILAILKAGAAYIPLDPDYPQARLAYCIQDSSPQLICTETSVALPAVDTPVLRLDDAPLYQNSPDNPPTLSQPDDLAYIIYTSGSTGQPKGVMVSHRNLVHSTVARFQVYPDPVRRFLLLSSIAFDSSVAGLFWTLCQGGTLVIAPPRIEQDLQQLTDLIEREKISHTLCVPTLYDLLIKSADPSQLVTLQTVIVAGEACLRSLVKQHYSRLPKTELYNEYGPTEATVWCTAHRIPADPPPGPISIGSAIPHTKIYLLDASLRPVPTGAIGEIYVGGAGVTQGYLNQADRTAAAFLKNPFCGSDSPTADNLIYKTGDLARYRADGSLEWLGRVDRQVKIRGYRIELGEIETVLRSHPTVKETVVVARSLSTATDSTVSEGIDPNSIDSLARSLAALPPDQADALLSAVEGER